MKSPSCELQSIKFGSRAADVFVDVRKFGTYYYKRVFVSQVLIINVQSCAYAIHCIVLLSLGLNLFVMQFFSMDLYYNTLQFVSRNSSDRTAMQRDRSSTAERWHFLPTHGWCVWSSTAPRPSTPRNSAKWSSRFAATVDIEKSKHSFMSSAQFS